MGTGARAKKMCDIDAVRRGNVLRRGSRMRAISIAAALVVALVTTAGVSAAGAQAATPTFSAHGSAEQVYVTGLEPATNYPNFKSFERQQGRVRLLPPGGRWEARWSIEVADTPSGVAGLMAEVAMLQAQARSHIHRKPQPRFTPL